MDDFINSLKFARWGYEDMLENRHEIQALGYKAYSEHIPKLSKVSASDFERVLLDDETWNTVFNSSVCLTCMMEGKIIGMAFFISSGNPWKFFEPEWSYIRLVAVDPLHSGRGIAKVLTLMCIGEAISNNETTLCLHTSEFQDAARKVYESLGFEKFKTLGPIWDKQFWIYSLNLKQGVNAYAKNEIENYSWGENCRASIIAENERMSLKYEIMPVSASERSHRHNNAVQIFYILKGHALIKLEGENHYLQPHQALLIDKGLIHKIENIGNNDLEFLVFSSPDTKYDRIEI